MTPPDERPPAAAAPRTTAIAWEVTDSELEVLIALLGESRTNSFRQLLDLAVWKLGDWYDLDMPPDAFASSRHARRDVNRRHEGAELAPAETPGTLFDTPDG
jgi:hypothetical protein